MGLKTMFRALKRVFAGEPPRPPPSQSIGFGDEWPAALAVGKWRAEQDVKAFRERNRPVVRIPDVWGEGTESDPFRPIHDSWSDTYCDIPHIVLLVGRIPDDLAATRDGRYRWELANAYLRQRREDAMAKGPGETL